MQDEDRLSNITVNKAPLFHASGQHKRRPTQIPKTLEPQLRLPPIPKRAGPLWRSPTRDCRPAIGSSSDRNSVNIISYEWRPWQLPSVPCKHLRSSGIESFCTTRMLASFQELSSGMIDKNHSLARSPTQTSCAAPPDWKVS